MMRTGVNDVRVIGITGGIGAGKSVVSRILRCKGFEVYDCDMEARALMEASELLKQDISAELGEECILEDGSIDRKAVARYVFSDDQKRIWLNSRVHALVRDHLASAIQQFSEKAGCAGSKNLFFVESAILNTGGLTPFCNAVWLVEASVDMRVNRVMARDNAHVADVEARINSQNEEFSDFGKLPVVAINNDGSQSLLNQIEYLINSIC